MNLRITGLNFNPTVNCDNNRTNCNRYPNLAPLKSDCVSFGKHKKHKKTHFNRPCQLNLSNVNLKNNQYSNKTGWVVIPSRKNDPDNYRRNVNKLKALSPESWSLASFWDFDGFCLDEGDFHVYFENGKPKLGVQLIDDEIQGIHEEENYSKLSPKYIEILKQHIEENDLGIGEFAEDTIAKLEKIQKKFLEFKRGFEEKTGHSLEKGSAEEILQYVGIETERDKDGFLIISEYRRPSEDFSFDDLGIDENKLFKDIKEIKGNADFMDSKLISLDSLQSIGKSLVTNDKKQISFPNLKNYRSWFVIE